MSKFLRANAGHGSTDPGAIGKRNGKTVYERDIVYDFGSDFIDHVKKNYDVETSFGHEKPNGGDFPKNSNGYYNTGAYGTKEGVYISFHLNSGSSSAKGTECWYGKKWGDTVAKLLNAVLDDVFVDRNCKYSDANGDGYEDFYIIRECGFDTICELCFISNEADLDLLYKNWDTLISKMASALAGHYGWKKKSGGSTVNKPNKYTKAVALDSQYSNGEKDHRYYNYENMKVDVPVYRVSNNKQSGTIKKGHNQMAYYAGTRNGRKIAKFFSNGNWHYFYTEKK